MSEKQQSMDVPLSAPMELSAFIQIARSRHSALMRLRPNPDQTVNSRPAPDEGCSTKRKRSDEVLARREQRAKRRRERDQKEQDRLDRIRTLDAEIEALKKQRRELYYVMSDIIKQKNALYELKAELVDERDKALCEQRIHEMRTNSIVSEGEEGLRSKAESEECYLKMKQYFDDLHRKEEAEVEERKAELVKYIKHLEDQGFGDECEALGLGRHIVESFERLSRERRYHAHVPGTSPEGPPGFTTPKKRNRGRASASLNAGDFVLPYDLKQFIKPPAVDPVPSECQPPEDHISADEEVCQVCAGQESFKTSEKEGDLKAQLGAESFETPEKQRRVTQEEMRAEFGPESFITPEKQRRVTQEEMRAEFGPESFITPEKQRRVTQEEMRAEFGDESFKTPDNLIPVLDEDVQRFEQHRDSPPENPNPRGDSAMSYFNPEAFMTPETRRVMEQLNVSPATMHRMIACEAQLEIQSEASEPDPSQPGPSNWQDSMSDEQPEMQPQPDPSQPGPSNWQDNLLNQEPTTGNEAEANLSEPSNWQKDLTEEATEPKEEQSKDAEDVEVDQGKAPMYE